MKDKFIAALPINIQSILLDVTNICIYSCRYCWYHGESNFLRKGPKEPYSLPTDRILMLIDDMQTLGVKRFIITGEGEPTNHPGFVEIAQKLATTEIKSTLQTNGTFHSFDHLLHINELHVQMSALQQDTFDKLMVKKCSFGTPVAIQNMRSIAEHTSRPKLQLLYILNRFNMHELHLLPEVIAESKADELFIKIVDITPGVNEHLLFTNTQARGIAKQLIEIKHDLTCEHNILEICRWLLKHYDGNSVLRKKMIKESVHVCTIKACFNALQHFYIQLDGNVYHCDKNGCPQIIGSILTDRLTTIVGSQRHREIIGYNIFNFDDWQVCKKCPHAEFQEKMWDKYGKIIERL